ncbi:MAG TPA: response regulator transcription factor [Dehalococcoidia bacterium]|nr:response regulator transcription factor [Dehalococcoidia bacterium]
MKKILVVDDEPTLVATLKYNLERESFEVLTASDGEAALVAARENSPDLIVLDLMLPTMSGLEVCRILRKETSVPILMLTAKGEELDKVVGLEVGADDYVTKPFGMPELMARVRAMLRRAAQSPQQAVEVLSSGDLRLDLVRREAMRGGALMPLKPKEFDLLTFFMRHPGRAFTREELLSQVWGYEFAGDTRTVDVHLRWLRQKIEQEPGTPTRLITVRSVGYRFEG